MITVIGGTGNVGRGLVEELRGAGHPVRILTRREGPVQDGVERVVGDLRDPDAVARALAGADRLFWLIPIETGRSADGGPIDDRAIPEQAARAGVRHVVLLSSIGAASPLPLGRHHREREGWIEESGLAWTFLRPGFFMSNALQWAAAIASAGRVSSPAPDGPTAPIAPADVAAVAALVLTVPGHERRTYTLTGGELISAREQIAALAGALGKPIECVETSIASAADQLRRAGRPEWLVDSLVAMWNDVRSGNAAGCTDTFTTLTGRAPQSFAAWCRVHRSAFGG